MEKELVKRESTDVFEDVLKLSLDGKILIPSAEIARLHDVDVRVVNQAFQRHQAQFIKGIDYFTFNKNEIERAFPESQTVILELFTNNAQKVVYLFTYKGYFNFVKIINSKHAWDMFHKMKEVVFHVMEMSKEDYARRLSKDYRNDLTRNLVESGEQERMHGFGISNYTLMIYRSMGIKDTYIAFHKENPKGNFRDTLSAEQLKTIKDLEALIVVYVNIGKQYSDIADVIDKLFSDSKKLDK